MKLNPAHIDAFRRALAVCEPQAFGLVDVEIFPGATIYSRRSTLVCKFDTKAKKLLQRAGEKSAELIESKLGLPIVWGVRAEAGRPLALWLEYLPRGARYDSAHWAMQALRAAFASVAAEPGGKLSAEAAERELARFEKAPVRDIFQSLFILAAARHADLPVGNVGGSSAALSSAGRSASGAGQPAAQKKGAPRGAPSPSR